MSLESMLKKAEKFGEAEIERHVYSSYKVGYERENIDVVNYKNSVRYYLRLVKNGRVVSTSFTDGSQFPRVLRSVMKLLKFSEKVEGYHLPDSGKYQKVKTWSNDLDKLDLDDLIEFVTDGIDSINGTGASPMEGSVSLNSIQTSLVNSHGIDLMEYSNSISAYYSAIYKTGTGYDFHYSGLPDFDPRELGKNAGKMAIENSKAKKQSWDGVVVLHPDVIGDFVDIILDAVDGDEVRLKSSPWVGKLDKEVLGKLTIIEDPWIPYMPSSSSFDSEGIPTQKKHIVEEGILKTYLYDTLTAARVGTKSTGNGVRSNGGGISIDVTNIVLDFDERENLDGLDNYLMIKELMGFHNANPKTGAFSLTLNYGVLHKSGDEIPVKGGLFVGNVYELFRAVSLASKQDYKRGDLITPYLVTEGKLIS